MRFTRKLMHAVEAVLDIAYHASNTPVQSKDIADRQGVPRRYLEQVLQQLVRANILRGVRGPRGGYRLARERRRILLGEVVRVVADMERAEAEAEDEAASELGRCVLAPIWDELEEEAIRRLDDVTIEDVCRKAREAGIEGQGGARPDFRI
jgi:Rrf2 family protein